jgi:hypothetical protein
VSATQAILEGVQPVSTKPESNKRQVVGFLGVGLDNADGHHRLTQSEHFILIGGSEETHERLQETAIKFDEGLEKRGKRLQDVSVEEVIEIFHETAE